MTPIQFRMAKAALGWTSRQVANAADLPTDTVTAMLRGEKISVGMAARMRSALEAECIVFIEDDGNGPGVRFKEDEKPSLAVKHPKPSGPATDVIERMEAEIAADRQKPGRKL